jgi:hypothetical protein
MKNYHKSVSDYADVQDCMEYAMERGNSFVVNPLI